MVRDSGTRRTQSEMAFQVGSDVEALCNTCGDVWHVVVAKVGEKITKVQCKQCGKQHRFKPTAEAPEANLKPVKRTVVDAPKPRAGKAPARPRAVVTSSITHDPSKPSLPYAISARFTLGDQIQHKKFGPGVVCSVEDDKIRVNFSDGVKVLLHGKTL
jgi:transcription elongation factor Elf1